MILSRLSLHCEEDIEFLKEAVLKVDLCFYVNMSIC